MESGLNDLNNIVFDAIFMIFGAIFLFPACHLLDNTQHTVKRLNSSLLTALRVISDMSEVDNSDDFAKMFFANISDYLRNVHSLEVKDVSQRDTGEYRVLVDFEDQVISICFTRDRDSEQAQNNN